MHITLKMAVKYKPIFRLKWATMGSGGGGGGGGEGGDTYMTCTCNVETGNTQTLTGSVRSCVHFSLQCTVIVYCCQS